MLLKDLTFKIENLKKTMELKPEDISSRLKIYEQIYKSLKFFYPECQLLIYGSTLNGYGTKESDLDLLFKPSPDYHEVTEKKEGDRSPTIYEINSGKVAKEELLLMNRLMQLCFVKRVLRRDKTFEMIKLIQARCPIVHFRIPCLKITCDISCGSSHVVSNTQLLKFYNQIDPRLQPLVIALRHWGKSLGFIQTGILSSYAFTLLVIFFLQNVEPAVLPPVKHLQKLSESPIIENGWNVAFTLDSHKVKKSENTQSLGELFREFFCFCGEFDFSNNVICPNSGKSFPIKTLLNTSDDALKEFEISPMCIQDPFLLSCNTSRTLKMHLLYFFKRATFLTVKIIDGAENDFKLLFDREEYTKLCTKCLNPPMSEKSVAFPIHFNMLNFWKDSVLKKQRVYELACEALLDLLQYGLLTNCEVIDRFKLSAGDFLKAEDQNCHFQLLQCIQCAIYNRTFVGRGKLKDKEIPVVDCDSKQFCNPIIRDEHIVSNYLIQQNPLLTSPEPFFWFYCDVYLSFLGKSENFIVVLTPLTESKERKTVFAFLQSFLEKCLPKVLMSTSDLNEKKVAVGSLSASYLLDILKSETSNHINQIESVNGS